MTPWILCIILSIIILLLIIKILFIHKDIDNICLSFNEHLSTDTNTLISISGNDKYIKKLAIEINKSLKEVRKEKRKFQNGNLELKEAITNISHDIRTPLTAISGYLELLEDTEKNETVSRYFNIIKNRTDALTKLSEELFQYSIVTSSEYSENIEPVIINSCLEESIAGFYALLKEKKITPIIKIPENNIVRVVNKLSLSRIFSNILNNAIKYSDGDLFINMDTTGKIIFSNTASNLNKVAVEKLFDRFYTLENAKKSTGLGLSISKILIEQMQGTISAEYDNNMLNIIINLPDNI